MIVAVAMIVAVVVLRLWGRRRVIVAVAVIMAVAVAVVVTAAVVVVLDGANIGARGGRPGRGLWPRPSCRDRGPSRRAS
jgi:hypothetical protein